VARAQAFAGRVRETLAALDGVTVDVPEGPLASLVVFGIEGVDAEQASAALEGRGVLVRWIAKPRRLRASVGAWTDEGDLTRLLEGVAALRL
jgi:selenocysteine lyase/cysteine desulfurase